MAETDSPPPEVNKSEERCKEIQALKIEIYEQREKHRCLEQQYEAARSCLEAAKRQACELTASNECLRRERDQLSACNQTLKCKVRALEQEICRINKAIELLKQKLEECAKEAAEAQPEAACDGSGEAVTEVKQEPAKHPAPGPEKK